MSSGDPRDDVSSAPASPFPAAYGSVGGPPETQPSGRPARPPGRRPLSELRVGDPSAPAKPAGSGRGVGRLNGRRRPGRVAPVAAVPVDAGPVEVAERKEARAGVATPLPRRAEPERIANLERAVAPVGPIGPVVGPLAVPPAMQSTVAPPRPARAPRRPPVAPPPPVPETPAVDPHDRRTPDWMAKRVAESQVPGASYEVGKQRRWRRRKVTVMRSRANRRLIRRIDIWTVFKVSFVFYLIMVAVVLVAGVVTWSVAQHLGFVTDIQKSVRSLADDKKFILHGNVALRYAAAGGAVLGVLGTLFNTVSAMLYNLLSDVFGGVQIVVVTEPD